MGIGLSICYNLTRLLGAKIHLDPSYDSGIEERPGSRFVVDLQRSPLGLGPFLQDCPTASPREIAAENALVHLALPSNSDRNDEVEKKTGRTETTTETADFEGRTEPHENQRNREDLPSYLDVLFVDDETILRKLFVRLVKKAAPTWNVTEANSGERVLQLIQEKHFDIIFIDQYMPCQCHTLLGTEIIRKLRGLGVSSMICGLSKNQIRQEFMDAGADCFLLKPVPCKKDEFHSLISGLCEKRDFAKSNKTKLRETAALGKASSSVLLDDTAISENKEEENASELPTSMNVLLVDDENILRKLFVRFVRKVAPTWTITEATNGEQAIELVRTNKYGLIFMDQYMPSTGREPILGTDVVRQIRRMGVTSLVCGLSANEMQFDFYAAGADWFILKPFPCDKGAFLNELVRFCNTRKLRAATV